jgi:uncharacterized Zn-finger protein
MQRVKEMTDILRDIEAGKYTPTPEEQERWKRDDQERYIDVECAYCGKKQAKTLKEYSYVSSEGFIPICDECLKDGTVYDAMSHHFPRVFYGLEKQWFEKFEPPDMTKDSYRFHFVRRSHKEHTCSRCKNIVQLGDPYIWFRIMFQAQSVVCMVCAKNIRVKRVLKK